MSEKSILNEIDQNKEEYIEFLRKIIQADSINPPGNEKNVAIIIEDYLKEKGIKSEIFPFGDNRANLFSFLNNNFNGKCLVFNGHMDVVPTGDEKEWKYPPFSAFIKRKKFIYGRGTTDMKASLSAMVIALSILKKFNIETTRNIILNAVADEETGGNFGTKWCLENYLQSKNLNCNFLIIGEPTGFHPLPKAIILGEKGHIQLKIITNGIACHSSVPFLGKNAISMMSEIVLHLDELDDFLPNVKPPMSEEKIKELISATFPNREHFDKVYNEQPLIQNFVKSLTKYTKSINMISGGIKANIIPNRCEAVMDIRTLPGQNTKMLVEALKKLIEKIGYEVRYTPHGNPEDIFVYLEVLNDAEASYWKNWEKSKKLMYLYSLIERIYKKRPFYSLYPAAADAHYYRASDYCNKTLLFGAGNAAKAHTIDEYIELEDYINVIKVYTLFSFDYLKKP